MTIGWNRRLAVAFAALAALLATGVGAQEIPVPRPRPTEAGPPATVPAPSATIPPATEGPPVDEACLARLNAAGIQFEPALPIASANAACAIDTPVRLKAVNVPSRSGAIVRLPDEPVLACRFGERLGHWLGDLVAPLIAGRLSVDVRAVRTGPGYDCRNRNRAAAGQLSAHAIGLAVDISRFELANGGTLPVKPDGDERARAAVEALRTAACGWFTTVLGPGSDAAHADHMHVDILQHGSTDRYRICQ